MRDSGADCVRFIAGVMIAVGVWPADLALPWRISNWSQDFADGSFVHFMGRVAVPITTAEPGDILVYRYGPYPCHPAILVAPGKFIHCYLPAGGVEIASTRSLAHRLHSSWRVEPQLSPGRERRAFQAVAASSAESAIGPSAPH